MISPREEMTPARSEEALVVITRHCRDMKRQETRLRLATAFLLLSSVTVLLVLHAPSRDRATDQTATVGRLASPVLQGKRPGVHLMPLAQHRNNTKPIQWEPRFNNGFSLTANNTLLTVPLDGLYYVYFGISYRIPGNYCEQKGVDRIQDLHTQVFKFTASYPKDIVIIKSIDSMTCTILAQRFVYAGQLIQLLKNDKLKMIIHTPHEVVNWFKGGIYFGAFLS
ncbi:uncharacterized protein LOC114786855 [Denticeps clupeoides]|uniref:uncharacterized protein LOC114786855 n=1 Tax=Denticeps clupeoides TaxID=299321 RepID=UPI0010A4D842|nr:uncharacterized protein LOC114786855 [Denticeps clupeoides]